MDVGAQPSPGLSRDAGEPSADSEVADTLEKRFLSRISLYLCGINVRLK